MLLQIFGRLGHTNITLKSHRKGIWYENVDLIQLAQNMVKLWSGLKDKTVMMKLQVGRRLEPLLKFLKEDADMLISVFVSKNTRFCLKLTFSLTHSDDLSSF
jgi:hypothetical protein